MPCRGFPVYCKPLLYPVKQVLRDNGGNPVWCDDMAVAVLSDVLPVFQQTGHEIKVDFLSSHRGNASFPHTRNDLFHRRALVVHSEHFQHSGGGAWVDLVLHILVDDIAESRCTAVVLAFQGIFRMAPYDLFGQFGGVIFRHAL